MRALGRLGPVGSPASFLVPLLVAGATFWVAYDGGSYDLASRATVAIAAWWGVLLLVAFRLVPGLPLPAATVAEGGILAGLTAWTFLSLAWAPSAEEAFDEGARALLYLGLYALVALAARRSWVGAWCGGLALALVAAAAVALASRLAPGAFPDQGIPAFLPSAATRLSFPLGYWNGLAVLVALAVPLLLRQAVVGRGPAARGVALVPIPAIASVVYLTSSRTGVATALAGTAVFLALARRFSALAAVLVAAAGAAAALAALADRPALVDGPLDSALAREQGRSAGPLILAACLACGAVYAIGSALLGRASLPRWLGRSAAAAILVAAAAVIVAADPGQRVAEFKEAPWQVAGGGAPGVSEHLVSGSGSGRWQFWTAAVDQWRAHPVVGQGAGTYEHWWAEHAPFPYFVRDAHSLYLEALGELGIPGLLLVSALAATGVAVGAFRARRAEAEERATVAALAGGFTGYAAAAGLDWMWEMTAASVVGVALLGLVTGPATAVPGRLRAARATDRPPASPGWRFARGVALVAVAWLAICAQALPLLAHARVRDSQRLAARGDLAGALEAASAARDIEPWAATPYLQLALVSEEAGRLEGARAWIDRALARDPRDWRLWLVSARLETKVGRVEEASRRLRRALALNPRSPLLRSLVEPPLP